jgi:RNA:NAD 2'-phosphotransferase (TPT1/KptA family)
MSKYLSYLLRHGATKEGLSIDGEGFILVNDLLSFLKARKKKIQNSASN